MKEKHASKETGLIKFEANLKSVCKSQKKSFVFFFSTKRDSRVVMLTGISMNCYEKGSL